MTPEGKVKKKIRDYLKEVGCYYFTPIGSVYGKSGVPDYVVCYEGMFIGIEAKAPGKLDTQTPLQKVAQEKIEKSEGIYMLVDSVDPVKSLFEALLT